MRNEILKFVLSIGGLMAFVKKRGKGKTSWGMEACSTLQFPCLDSWPFLSHFSASPTQGQPHPYLWLCVFYLIHDFSFENGVDFFFFLGFSCCSEFILCTRWSKRRSEHGS